MTSRTVLADVGGFTPVIDHLVQELGLRAAAVFGVVWRFCQLPDKVCYASLETIGDRLGLQKGTVYKDVMKLVAAGYLKDVSPDDIKKRRPHIYADTGKAQIRINIEATVSDTSQARRSGVSTGNNSFPGKHRVSTGNTNSFPGKPKIEVLRDDLKKENKTAAAATPNAATAAEISPEIQANLKALQEAGVRGEKLQLLAGLPHVTPDFVRQHSAARAAENADLAAAGQRLKGIPILIRRLEENELPLVAEQKAGRGTGIAGGTKIGREQAPFKIPDSWSGTGIAGGVKIGRTQGPSFKIPENWNG